ncbi:hypothetical protein CFL01nite_24160 [Corynebacterium flavescens]|uniref:Uncharacterized protein n=1 Tax=Corynebacterium flavescens TaxID=28028 RepID=A0AB73BAT0_CORFL|nr:hypothetical protein CFL01nite_24160 [Corynebacterium flavescens]
MGLIGQTCKHCKVLRLLVLIDQNKHTHTHCCVAYRAQKIMKNTRIVFASTMQYLTQYAQAHPTLRWWVVPRMFVGG